MVERARKRQIYDVLHVAEITAFLGAEDAGVPGGRAWIEGNAHARNITRAAAREQARPIKTGHDLQLDGLHRRA